MTFHPTGPAPDGCEWRRCSNCGQVFVTETQDQLHECFECEYDAVLIARAAAEAADLEAAYVELQDARAERELAAMGFLPSAA